MIQSGVIYGQEECLRKRIAEVKTWIDEAKTVMSVRSNIQKLKDVISKADSIKADLTVEMEPIKLKIKETREWILRVRKTVPIHKKTRRSIPAEKLDLDRIKGLLEDAPVHDENNELQHMFDVVETAEEWLGRVRESLASGSIATLNKLKSLSHEGSEMPVSMEEQAYLSAEISARDWAERAQVALEEIASFEVLKTLQEEARVLRLELLPSLQHTWKVEQEKIIIERVEEIEKWILDVVILLGPQVSTDVFCSLADFKDSIPLTQVSHEKQFVSVLESLINTNKEDLRGRISDFIPPLEKIVLECKELDSSLSKLLDTLALEVKQQRGEGRHGDLEASLDTTASAGVEKESRITMQVLKTRLEQVDELPLKIECGEKIRVRIYL